MIKNIGIEIPQDIFNLLKSGKVLAHLITFSDKGIPNLTLVSTIFPKNRESILLTMLSDNVGYRNMVWQKKVVLSIIEGNNIAINIIGRAGVLLAPSRVHPTMHVAQIDVIDIFDDLPILISIENGIGWRHASSETKVLHDALIKELQECALKL
jgi:hypothetical protein